MTTAIQAYAFGNCTYYVATRFPRIYPWLGNAKDWITSAKTQGYQILNRPTPDTVVVYGPGNGYSSLGHVAVVDSVNSDGTFQVSEMNYRGYDLVDQRRSSTKGVIGFIVPPGSSYKPPVQAFSMASSSATKCVTGSTHIGGGNSSSSSSPKGNLVQRALGLAPLDSPTLNSINPFPSVDICWDGVVGVLAIAGGGLLMVLGVGLFAVFALQKTGITDRMGSLIPLAGGPVGAAVAVANSSKPKAKPVAPTVEEGKAASEARVARAKARLSPGTQAEVDAAKRGEGKKLSAPSRVELEQVKAGTHPSQRSVA